MVLRKIGDGINRMICVLAAIFLAVLICASALQVITRYILNASLSWSDELARYSFIWCSMLGATVAYRQRAHAVVDALVSHLTGTAHKIQKTFVYLCVMYISTILMWFGFKALTIVSAQKSTALHLPMSFVYASLPICMLIIAVYAVMDIVTLYHGQEQESSES